MTRRTLVAVTAVVAVLGFALVAVFYDRGLSLQTTATIPPHVLVRPHSPIFGPKDAPVTIVEFFDPSCGTCRAFHPIVKQIRDEYPDTVRVVMRYAIFHKGSDEVVRIMETARLQGILEPVLEALLDAQPAWTAHGGAPPNLGKAWQAASDAGLNVTKARRDRLSPDITANMNQDMADVNTAGVDKTPTFFVNGRPLPSFGAKQLHALVSEEVAIARRASGG